MTITVQINTDSDEGKSLEEMLRRHSKTVRFIDPTTDTQPLTDANVIGEEYPKQGGETLKSISATESAQLAFGKLGKKYNCTFENKFTK